MPETCKPSRACGCQVKTLRVGGKVDFARRSQGLTVAGFAKKCGVPEGTMEAICLRQRDPSTRTFFRILTKGHVALDLFEDEDFGEEGLL